MTLAIDDNPQNPTGAELLHVSVGSAATGAHFSFDWSTNRLGLKTSSDGEVHATDEEFLVLLNFVTQQAMRGSLAKKNFDDRRRG
jgi:hypothetical protein